jgi:hypothetical protein
MKFFIDCNQCGVIVKPYDTEIEAEKAKLEHEEKHNHITVVETEEDIWKMYNREDE